MDLEIVHIVEFVQPIHLDQVQMKKHRYVI